MKRESKAGCKGYLISSVYSLSPAARVEGRILNSVGGLRAHLVCDNLCPVSRRPRPHIFPSCFSGAQPFPGMTSSLETQLCRPLEPSLISGTGAVTDGDVTAQAGLRTAPSKPCCTQRLGFEQLSVVELKNICCLTQVNTEVKTNRQKSSSKCSGQIPRF